MAIMGKSLWSGFGAGKPNKKEEIIKPERYNRKCPDCGKHMLQGRITLQERGNKRLGLIYCPEDVGMLEDGAQAVIHESTYYDPAFYCESCKQGVGEFSLRMDWGSIPKVLQKDRGTVEQCCPYCNKQMEQGNFFIAFLDSYNLDWYEESLFENRYTAPLRKRSFSLRRAKALPNAYVCKKCKKVFSRFPLLRDYRKGFTPEGDPL